MSTPLPAAAPTVLTRIMADRVRRLRALPWIVSAAADAGLTPADLVLSPLSPLTTAGQHLGRAGVEIEIAFDDTVPVSDVQAEHLDSFELVYSVEIHTTPAWLIANVPAPTASGIDTGDVGRFERLRQDVVRALAGSPVGGTDNPGAVLDARQCTEPPVSPATVGTPLAVMTEIAEHTLPFATGEGGGLCSVVAFVTTFRTDIDRIDEPR